MGVGVYTQKTEAENTQAPGPVHALKRPESARVTGRAARGASG